MGPYAASKAGVEALTDALRVETAPTGARVGCGFIDTDIVRGSFAHPSTKAMERLMPGFVRKAAPVDVAVDAIERGIRRRSARVWAPRLAQPDAGDLHAQDEKLGVSRSRPEVGA